MENKNLLKDSLDFAQTSHKTLFIMVEGVCISSNKLGLFQPSLDATVWLEES